ncbi:polysaccharide pyruvyl transferase family protein [uncultured Rhodoblastus sp.]|uniref:polysaccharide pyruvyl transferase family protein n=1 Tax=uncultured Rhodoblastus sp. TaxID=543037 RepID=UPI0025FEFCBB|nr:polysaccharide pyruvyl transferase family protein [uncultured Rhodoblastus sp.]
MTADADPALFAVAAIRNWTESGANPSHLPVIVEFDEHWDPYFDTVSSQIGIRATIPASRISGVFDGAVFGFNPVLHNYSGILLLQIDDQDCEIDLFQPSGRSVTKEFFVVSGLGKGRHTWSLTILNKNAASFGNEAILFNFAVDPAFLREETFVDIEISSELIFERLHTLQEVEGQKIISVFCSNTKNTGDQMCAPMRHIPFLQATPKYDMYDWHPHNQRDAEIRRQFNMELAQSTIVLGGGGLLENEDFAPALDYILSSNESNIVLWGAGHNNPELKLWSKIKQPLRLNANRFALLGVRDDQAAYRWLPCVSCLHRAFDSDVTPTRPVGIVLHGGESRENRAVENFFAEFPTIDNYQPIEQIIQFIKESELVVTNSYHGAYWAILANRPVVAIPNSSKFYDFKWQIPLCDVYDWKRASKLAVAYPKALQEARYKNLLFAESFHQLLSLQAARK